ncbi:MAG: hypothetical protein CMH59_10440 [Myxococcales bacterium]|nr:hypothetical protein [Myxococcales bacterium]
MMRPLALALGFLLASCSSPAGPSTGDSNTNWLDFCASDVDCPTGGRCLCGVCTRPCEGDGDCVAVPGARALCVPTAKEYVAPRCGVEVGPEEAICLSECETDLAPCKDGFLCVEGACAPGPEVGDAGLCACPGCAADASRCAGLPGCEEMARCALESGCSGDGCVDRADAPCIDVAHEIGRTTEAATTGLGLAECIRDGGCDLESALRTCR